LKQAREVKVQELHGRQRERITHMTVGTQSWDPTSEHQPLLALLLLP